ncbi:hypothetical protein AB1Y20_019403 [Prymnesium parvum]|uniref:Uncharacterized protein n=1 Tax=Prymnesium parvum TaxID=97485 RepID=A0AB34JSB4_PRYPA
MRRSLLGLGVVSACVVATIAWVHNNQLEERKAMRAAVLADIEKLGRQVEDLRVKKEGPTRAVHHLQPAHILGVLNMHNRAFGSRAHLSSHHRGTQRPEEGYVASALEAVHPQSFLMLRSRLKRPWSVMT